MKEIHIFLASSEELSDDRKQINELIGKLQLSYIQRGIRLILDQWENQNPAFKGERTQNEYNYLVRKSNLFVALFHHKAGKYTQEEFDVAYEYCMKYKAPHICIYYKALQPKDEEEESLQRFKKRIMTEIEYFTIPPYSHIDTLRLSLVIQIAFLVSGSYNFENEIRNSQIYYNGIRIADLDKIPFSYNNPEIIDFKEKLITINEKIKERLEKLSVKQAYLLKWEEKYKQLPDSDFLENIQMAKDEISVIHENLENLYIEKDRLNNQIQEQNKCLLNVAIEINRCASKASNDVLSQATILFENGKCNEAVNLLCSKEIIQHINQSICDYKQVQDFCEASVNKLETSFNIMMLTAKSILADLNNPNRFNKACEARRKALSIAKLYVCPEEYCYLLYKFARFLDKNNHVHQAVSYYFKALNYYQEFLLKNPLRYDVQLNVAKCYNRMGNLYNKLGDLKKAETFYNKSNNMYINLRNKHLEEYIECKLLLIQNNLGVLYYKMGDKEYGQTLIKKQIEKYNHWPQEKKNKYLQEIANCWINLGTFYRQDTRKDRQAKRCLEKALDCYMQLNSLEIGRYESLLADCYYQLGLLFKETDFNKSEEYLLKARDIYLKMKEIKPESYYPKLARTYESLGNLYFSYYDEMLFILLQKAILNYTTALSYGQALERIEQIDSQQNYGHHTAFVGNLYFILGNLYKLDQKYETSIRYFERSNETFMRLSVINKAYNHLLICSYEELATIYGQVYKRWQLAEKYFEYAINLALKYYPTKIELLVKQRGNVLDGEINRQGKIECSR